ncbi:glycosyltransferase [Agaribacterium haliotis]|uniref:glycosyltransferase n=1 Tax=Agaribacterium haliotis TaxID=2013869 RepID=UPI000BB59757|nr:glycosyltransferase [Agaribacterium haliotis]
MNRQHIVALDSIPYYGGSKASSATFLNELNKTGVDISVYSCNRASWTSAKFSSRIGQVKACRAYSFSEFGFLSRAEQGLAYYLRHLLISLKLLLLIIKMRLINNTRTSALVGTSGPGVDIAIYAVSYITGIPVIQLVHGPVAHSRLINLALARAQLVIALESEIDQLRLRSKELTIVELKNGLAEHCWPSQRQVSFEKLRLYWCASLLKWKGLDVFIEAVKLAEHTACAEIHYIKPKNTELSTSRAPVSHGNITAREQPHNLDLLRSQQNIFVSTSDNEPFGLSILEALAAGLLVVIPKDGAYWDQRLSDKQNCIKYPAGVTGLSRTISWMENNKSELEGIANAGRQQADYYRAEYCFSDAVCAATKVLEQVKNSELSRA